MKGKRYLVSVSAQVAPKSVARFSCSRAFEVVIGSWVRLLMGELGFSFSGFFCVTNQKKNVY